MSAVVRVKTTSPNRVAASSFQAGSSERVLRAKDYARDMIKRTQQQQQREEENENSINNVLRPPHVSEFVRLLLLGRAEPERLEELIALLAPRGVRRAAAATAADPRSGRQSVEAGERRNRCRGQLCRPVKKSNIVTAVQSCSTSALEEARVQDDAATKTKPYLVFGFRGGFLPLFQHQGKRRTVSLVSGS